MQEPFGSSIRRRIITPLGLVAIPVLLVACMSAPVPPTDSLNAARDAIAGAEQADARRYAGAELDEARQKLMLAEGAVSAERMIEAKRLAQQSRIAAELAVARTAYTKAEEINRQMGRGAEALDEEMRRMGDQQ
ncbi:MAG: DUF4398 domain-containing protein [Alcanivoracaceae bacterium]